ncbi:MULTISPECIES: alpha/beta hydrolase [unclassified Kitasatospora]|uniref:alpha/beta hydrolase n=1 Tax=unclassified Kitasatospora TaxID=2633591 RepID=UPI00070D96AD|nr:MULTISPECIES: alpha/beta hydrolase [unclassified Kitasatospora]KQV09878.1 esterase [Kitasatospora sp. Root107]KRB70118.1 esterase [Kitasatospora sp. Root187]
MTAFVLVSESFTGGLVWQEVTDRLLASGAEVHPATLTGLGDRRDEAGPGTDLETHVEDLVRLIDEVAAPELVIVGHGYGIHPVLGAADRRPGRIARIVYLDAGLPQNGDAALALVADPAVRQELLHPTDSGWGIAPPAADGWQRWGSTEGVSPDGLARLTELAAPQPRGTLTRPLELTGAVAALPTTGIICTAGGMSIAVVEQLVAAGPPQFRVLADPRVGFFELPTGHWPMLSAPAELADTLLRAAAGEGHRITQATGELPTFLRPFLLDLPERPRERLDRVDLYLPEGDGPHPAIVFVHGGPITAELRPTPRDWPQYVGYGRYAASHGVVGVTVDHRLYGLADFDRAAADVAAAVELVRADPRVDGDRVAVWFFSGGGLLSTDWLAAPPSWLRCLAATYPVLAPLASWGIVDPHFTPTAAVGGAGGLPVVLTRVGLESPEIAATVEEFLTAAAKAGVGVEVVDVPNGHHGYEVLDHTEESVRALELAMRSVLAHLQD